ncbi:hypothetical protein [Streptomyces pactum]|uniref:hypothetical protein n=1 Tax=Streptomyces pactum TaxID=68249 RepID=UPI0036F6E3AA
MPRHPVPDGDRPLFPMPPLTEDGLAAAIRRIDPAAAARFEEEVHDAWRRAAREDSVSPVRDLLHRWAVFVALRRLPRRAARLRELERIAAGAKSPEAVRGATAEIRDLVRAARREVAGRG